MNNSLEILDKLIAYPTISRTQNMDLINYIKGLLEDCRIPCTLIESDCGNNANLYATVGPQEKRGVMLSGHTDVVPIEGQDWTVDPFKMLQKDGLLYGRGTTDMKGFVACATAAMIRASEYNLETPLHLALSYDEEIGCVGVRRMIDVLADAPFRPQFCIIGEPTELAVATGHKGKTVYRVTCRGKEVHSALAPFGCNAIHLASDFVQMLRNKQNEIQQSGLQDGDYDVPYSTLHAGIISGGTALNIVPNTCYIDMEIRNLQGDNPDETMESIKSDVRDILKSYPDGAGVDIEQTNSYPGLNTAPDAEIVNFVKSLTGANNTIKVAFGTEGGLFSERLGVPSVVCGPGSMAQGHKPDEFISCNQIEKCDAMLDTLIERLSQ